MSGFASSLLWLLLASSPASAQDQADFAAANEKALAGDQAGAIALYESLLERGLRNEDVFFNLGNVHAESGRWVEAAVAYERALRLAPSDPAARENLARVRKQLLHGEEITPIEQPVEAVEVLVAPLPSTFARIGFVLASSLFFVAWFLRRQSSAKWTQRLLAAGLTVGLVLGTGLGLVLIGQEWVRLDVRAVVLTDESLREGPDARFREAGRARAGSRARVLERDGGWTKIQTEEGRSGWLDTRALEHVDPAPTGA